MQQVNRCVAIVKPKQPFLDWILANPALQPIELTLEELRADCIALLTPDFENSEATLAYLHDLKPVIFIEALDAWSNQRNTWHRQRTRQLFDQWFDLEIHSLVFDVDDAPLERD